MKKLIIAAAALMVSLAAYGQGLGQVSINNRIGTEVNARIVLASDAAGTSSVGTPDWTVSFLGGPVGTATSALQPLDPAGSAFRGAAGSSAAGYFTGQTPTIPGTTPGGSGLVLLRVSGPGGVTADFGPYTVNNLGGGTITPPNLALGTSPLTIVPEPTTLALGALGLGALLVIRRRK
jgi:MYXO-CTERM domain-containing protein